MATKPSDKDVQVGTTNDHEKGPSATSLFIKNIPVAVDEAALQAHFGGIGPLRTTTIVREKDTGVSKRFGFVRFAVPEHAALAMQSLDGSILDGRPLSIEFALPRSRQGEKGGKGDEVEKGEEKTVKPKIKRTPKGPLEKVEKKRPGLRGAISKRTVVLNRSDGEVINEQAVREFFASHNNIDKNPGKAGKNNDLKPESVILSADTKTARVLFKDWSQAGKAAAKAHGSGTYDAVVDALQSKAEDGRATLIIRNLPFQVSVKQICNAFIGAAPVRGVRVVAKDDDQNKGVADDGIPDSQLRECRGYAFVEMFTPADAMYAVSKVNGSKIGNRVVAMDVAVERKAYKRQRELAKNEGDDDDDSEEEEEEDDKKETIKVEEKPYVNLEDREIDVTDRTRHALSSPLELARTVFVRNILFECTGDEVWKVMEEAFGKVEQAVIVRHHATGLSRGSAFVRFFSPKSVKKAMDFASTAGGSAGDVVKDDSSQGLQIRGRNVYICQAVDRGRVEKEKEKNSATASEVDHAKHDLRNLRLANVGAINPESEEWKKLSLDDMGKRSKAERMKRNKLRNNPNSFVSDVRVCVRNLPKGIDERLLKGMCEMAAREDTGNGWTGGRVVHCKLVTSSDEPKSKKKKNRNDGDGKSIGFGFVTFEKHEDALKALKVLNNSAGAIDVLLKWMLTQKRKEKLIRDKKRKEAMKGKEQGKGISTTEGELIVERAGANDVRKMWGVDRKLIVDFAVEDQRKVRILTSIKEKGAKLKEENRKKKQQEERGSAGKQQLTGKKRMRKDERSHELKKMRAEGATAKAEGKVKNKGDATMGEKTGDGDEDKYLVQKKKKRKLDQKKRKEEERVAASSKAAEQAEGETTAKSENEAGAKAEADGQMKSSSAKVKAEAAVVDEKDQSTKSPMGRIRKNNWKRRYSRIHEAQNQKRQGSRQ